MTIGETVEKLRANENQCRRIWRRIEAITGNLKNVNDVTHRDLLMNMSMCVEECFAFISKFQDNKLWFTRVFNSPNAKDQFKTLNTELLQCATDLHLNLDLPQLFDDKQDALDQKLDLQVIQSKLDEIASKMLQEQTERWQHLRGIETNKEQRFYSYKHHLEQNMMRTEKNEKPIDREHSFLHIPYYDLVQEQCIGHGGFADVYRGRWISQDLQVAIKVIRIRYLGDGVKDDFMREISTMHQIRYEHVLNMFGACIEPDKYALVVEYMTYGCLFDILKRKTMVLSWPDRWVTALQMTKGINYLHTLPQPIIHRDVKSHNVLLTESARGFLVKIGDFGLARIRRETSLQSRDGPVVGTLPWKAPELLRMGRQTEASDVYALSIVYWELATGSEPYEDADEPTIRSFVTAGERLPVPDDIPQEFAKLITAAWKQEPHQRPTCQQLLEVLKGATVSDGFSFEH